jgi:dihydroorotate dehydrogenase
MGLYAAVGRPLFFSLPPEAAHRVAGAMLGLPLPWRRIGRAVEDAVLTTDLAGLPLRNPIGLAAGFDKTCAHLHVLGELGFGYVVGGTITRAARAGNPKPRIARDRARRSMVNAMGLPNPGAEPAAGHLRRHRDAPAPRIVSLADEAVGDAVSALELLAPLADGIELNASCPNVSWGRDTDNESHLRELVAAFRARTDRPVFVKVPPFSNATEREVVLALVSIAVEAGADGVTIGNTRPVEDARLTMGRGGRSGRDLWPATVPAVAAVREAVGQATAVNACGGVSSPDDVVTCLEAGATTVQIYSSLVYEGPGIVGTLTDGVSRRLRRRGKAVADLRVAAGPPT